MAKINPRKKKLDAICTRIAMFIVEETFGEEKEAQNLMGQAIGLLDKAAALLVASDKAYAQDLLSRPMSLQNEAQR